MDDSSNPTHKTTSPLSPAPSTESQTEIAKKPLPKGVVLGKDGKPCRSCTSVASWLAMSNATTTTTSPPPPPPPTTTQTPDQLPSDCPPDVAALGRSTWTFLHTLSASYPPRATTAQQTEMRSFLATFARLYPCWTCAEDLQAWMRAGNEPRVEGREGLGRWMCEAHNEVNRKLGKGVFECGRWEERWRTGGGEGRCG